LFYANLNIRLFFYLICSRAQIILSNDLDTLPACFAVSRIRRRKLVFDSHELFPEVPELVHRPKVRKIWMGLEKFLVPRVNYGLTVCDSIAEYYQKTYDVVFVTIRNLARFRYDHEFEGITGKKDKPVVLYQGALNLGRGLELAIESMQYLENAKLLIVGNGDIKEKLTELADDLGLMGRVEFLARVPFEQLWPYTASAEVGISLEEDLGLNYQYALPNKLFDYIQARIPVVVSDLPEMSSVVEHYRIGKILRERTPQKLAELIRESILARKKDKKLISDIELAARELCWEKEEDKLISLFKCVSISI
jgi:glycosyltransferase involved in cell wall biosynthesis